MENRVLGTGLTAAPGSSRTGRRISQAIIKDKIAFDIAEHQKAQASRSGMIGNVVTNKSSCAAKGSVQVIYVDGLRSTNLSRVCIQLLFQQILVSMQSFVHHKTWTIFQLTLVIVYLFFHQSLDQFRGGTQLKQTMTNRAKLQSWLAYQLQQPSFAFCCSWP